MVKAGIMMENWRWQQMENDKKERAIEKKSINNNRYYVSVYNLRQKTFWRRLFNIYIKR